MRRSLAVSLTAIALGATFFGVAYPVYAAYYSGGVIFSDGTSLIQSATASNFFWSEANKRLGLGTSTPWSILSINPNALGSGVPEFVIGSSSATHVIVTGKGNVGIGTTSPMSTLSVVGALSVAGRLQSAASAPRDYIDLGTGRMTFDSNGNDVNWDGIKFYTGNDNQRDLGAAGNSWRKLYLGSNLIVGTTTSTHKITAVDATLPQLALGDGTAGNSLFTERVINNNIIFATTSPTSWATTTTSTWMSVVGTTGTTLNSNFTVNGNATLRSLTLSSALGVPQGGTGQTSFASGNLLYGNGSGAVQNVATTSETLGSEFSYSGTYGARVGGTSGTLSLATNGIALSKLFQVAANTILGNPTGVGGSVSTFATSTLGIALSDTKGTLTVARGGTGQTLFTSGQLLYGNGTNALSTVATSSITAGTGITFTGTLGALIGGTNVALNIADTTVAVGGYGDASHVATFTVDQQGRLTAAGSSAISLDTSALTSGMLSIARGGTGASSFTTAGNALYYNGSSLLSAPLTSAVVTPYASSTAFSSTGSAYFLTGGAGSVGIGSTSPSGLLTISGTNSGTFYKNSNNGTLWPQTISYLRVASTSGVQVNQYLATQANASGSGAILRGLYSDVFDTLGTATDQGSMIAVTGNAEHLGTGFVGSLFGGTFETRNNSGKSSNQVGVLSNVRNVGTGASSTIMYSFEGFVNNTGPGASAVDAAAYYAYLNTDSGATGSTTNLYGFKLDDLDGGNGTIHNTYGVYVGDITSGVQTNNPYSFYASDAGTYNYFAGNTGIGSTTPGSLLSIGGNGMGWNFYDNATTTSSAQGINLINGGCFAINGICVGTAAGTGSGVINSGSAGQVGYYAAGGTTLSAAPSLFVDTSSSFVGIGTTAPGRLLDVAGVARGTIQDTGGEIYNVKAYGAVGDGTTDDTDAIRAAFAAATSSATGGGTVVFPSGTYIITHNLPLLSRVDIRGSKATIRVTAGGVDGFANETGGSVSGIHVSDLNVQAGNGVTPGSAFNLTAVSNSLFENINVVRSPNELVYFTYGFNVYSTSIAANAWYNTFTNNEVYVSVNSYRFDGDTTGANWEKINGGIAHAAGSTTILLNNGELYVQGMSLDGTPNIGIDVVTGTLMAMNNRFEFDGSPTAGIRLGSNSGGNVVFGNAFPSGMWGKSVISSAPDQNILSDGHDTTSFNRMNLVVTNGRIGVGTSGPQSLIEAAGTDNGTALSTFTASTTLSITNASVNNGAFSTLAFRSVDSNNVSTSTAQVSGVATTHTANGISGDLTFLTQSAGTLSEKMRILANGAVGIGTASPDAKLSIVGTLTGTATLALRPVSAQTADIIDIYNPSGTLTSVLKANGSLGLGSSSPSALLSISNSASTPGSTPLFVISSTTNGLSTTTVFSISNTGDVTINGSSGATCVIGTGTGGTSCTSDERLKTDIVVLPDALARIEQLRGVTFKWIDPKKDQSSNIGVIAQEVQKVFPELVTKMANGILTVDYASLVAPLIEAVKELAAKVDALAQSFANHFPDQNTLCVGQTCVTEAQLKVLLQNAQQTGSPAAPVSAPVENPAPQQSASTTDSVPLVLDTLPAPTPDTAPETPAPAVAPQQ